MSGCSRGSCSESLRVFREKTAKNDLHTINAQGVREEVVVDQVFDIVVDEAPLPRFTEKHLLGYFSEERLLIQRSPLEVGVLRTRAGGWIKLHRTRLRSPAPLGECRRREPERLLPINLTRRC